MKVTPAVMKPPALGLRAAARLLAGRTRLGQLLSHSRSGQAILHAETGSTVEDHCGANAHRIALHFRGLCKCWGIAWLVMIADDGAVGDRRELRPGRSGRRRVLDPHLGRFDTGDASSCFT